MSSSDFVVRFALALVASLAFGLTRQRRGKPIGFGTFTLVSLGACGLAITAVRFAHENPLPLLAAIVTGVGFLGAGALFRNQDRPVGFTSAATLWAFAVFGLSMGLGEYGVASLVYGALWLVALIDWRLENRWIGAYQRKLTISVSPPLAETELGGELGLGGLERVQRMRYDRELDELTVVTQISRSTTDLGLLMDRLRGDARVRSFELE